MSINSNAPSIIPGWCSNLVSGVKLIFLTLSKIKFEVLSSDVKEGMIQLYGSLYSGFESSVMDESAFKEEWQGKWVEDFIKIAIDNVTPPYVSIGGKFELFSYDSNGVDKIREALMSPVAVNEDTTLKIASNGSPSYRISVKAPNYKQAEDELKIAVDNVLKIMKKGGGSASFERSWCAL